MESFIEGSENFKDSIATYDSAGSLWVFSQRKWNQCTPLFTIAKTHNLCTDEEKMKEEYDFIYVLK